MKKSDAYKAASLAVINSELPEDAMFDVLCVLTADYNNEVWCESLDNNGYNALLHGDAAATAGDEL